MKKLIAVICAVLCLCFAGTTAFAESEPDPNVYTIEDADLSFTFAPDGDWYILTRDNLDGNDYITDYEQDVEDTLSMLEESSIYFDAFDYDITCELIVSSVSVGYIRNMDILHSVDMDKVVDMILGTEELEESGMEISNCRLETLGEQEYLCFDFSYDMDGETFYGCQYTTVINGQLTNFMLTSYMGEEPDAEMTELIEGVVSSVEYNGVSDTVFMLFSLIPAVLIIGVIVLIVVLAVRSSKKKRERQAAQAAAYGVYPSTPPMTGQPYQPYGQQTGAPTAPPMNNQPYPPYGQQTPPTYGQPYQPYAPQTPAQPAQPEDADAADKGSAEYQAEAAQHRDHCCACGAPLKPGDIFCNQCGMRNN